LPVGKINQLN